MPCWRELSPSVLLHQMEDDSFSPRQKPGAVLAHAKRQGISLTSLSDHRWSSFSPIQKREVDTETRPVSNLVNAVLSASPFNLVTIVRVHPSISGDPQRAWCADGKVLLQGSRHRTPTPEHENTKKMLMMTTALRLGPRTLHLSRPTIASGHEARGGAK